MDLWAGLCSTFTPILPSISTIEVNGDGIQQHDSRLQEGVNSQWLHPFKLFGQQALFTAGANFHDNQINVGLYPRVGRNPIGVTTQSNLHVTNVAGYVSQSIEFWQGRLHLNGGLRYDYFRFNDQDKIDPSVSGTQTHRLSNPKRISRTHRPSEFLSRSMPTMGEAFPAKMLAEWCEQPSAPKVATTDFYQIGTAHNWRRFSLSTDLFLIDQSNQQVYIPDDGSFEFKGPSRTYGYRSQKLHSVHPLPGSQRRV